MHGKKSSLYWSCSWMLMISDKVAIGRGSIPAFHMFLTMINCESRDFIFSEQSNITRNVLYIKQVFRYFNVGDAYTCINVQCSNDPRKPESSCLFLKELITSNATSKLLIRKQNKGRKDIMLRFLTKT